MSAALPWAVAPVLPDVLVFVIAIVFVKFRPGGLIAGEGSKAWTRGTETGVLPPMMNRRRFLQSAAWMGGAIATGSAAGSFDPNGRAPREPIKVGIATDLTGAIGLRRQRQRQRRQDAGQGHQQRGRHLGRPLELFIEDTASNESVAVANVRKLIQRDKVDVVLGGITSSMRNASRT